MTFDDLELFWALAECRSITKAAKASAISQPTASRRLQAMEVELGNVLVDRGTQPLNLTPFGYLFLDFADDVLKKYRAIVLGANQTHSVIGRLTVATSSSPAARIVTHWMADFIAAQPGVRLELWEVNSRGVEQCLLKGDALVGFMGIESDHPNIVSLIIAEDDIVLLIPSQPPFQAIHRPIGWDKLVPLPFIGRRSGSGTQAVVDSALDALGWPKPRHIVLEVDTGSAVIDAVESGLGAGFVSRELLFRRKLRHSAPVAIKELSLTRPFFLAYRSDRLQTEPIVDQFMRYAMLRLKPPSTSRPPSKGDDTHGFHHNH